MEYIRLKDIAVITMGQSPDSFTYNSERCGMPFYQGNTDFGEVYPTARVWCNSPKKIANKNDILISVRAPIGALNYAKENCCIGRGLAAITIEDDIERNFIYHFLKAKNQEIKDKGTGSTFKAIGKSVLEELKVPIFNNEQKLLSMKLMDSLESTIRQRKNQLQLLDNLIKARFVEMFGDPATPGVKFKTCKLGKVADVKSGHRVFTTEFVDEGVPFYRGTEIGVLASGQQPEDPYRISMEHYLKIASDDSKPLRGDLLLPSICNKGQVWMVNTDEPFYYKDGRVLCISPDRSVFDSRYLQFYMKMRTEAEYPKLGSGSTFAEFKIFQLKELEVDIPPMNAQKSFDLFVDQVDKSKYDDIRVEYKY